MATSVKISTVQDKNIICELRQGVEARLALKWLDADNTPLDINGMTLFAQIVTGAADKNPTIIHTFSSFPDVNGSRFEINFDNATTTIFMSDELTRLILPGKTYYLEGKLMDNGNAVESVVMELKSLPEYARQP